MGCITFCLFNSHLGNPAVWLPLTVADKKGGGFGAYKLSTQYKGNWNYTFSKPTKQPSFLSAVTGSFVFIPFYTL